jgi:hypothetical protein
MRPAQKCESPCFQRTYDKSFEPTYFWLRTVHQTPSSVNNLKSHFPRRVVFLTARSYTKTPSVFWLANNTPLSQSVLFFSLPLCQKNLDRKKSNLFKTPFGRRKKDNIYSTMFDRTEFMRTSLPPMDNNLPFQLLKCNSNLS